jgi:hypothetical protein
LEGDVPQADRAGFLVDGVNGKAAAVDGQFQARGYFFFGWLLYIRVRIDADPEVLKVFEGRVVI